MREYGDTVVQVGSECGNLEKCTIKTSKMAHSNCTVFRMGEKRRIPSMGGFPLDEQVVFCYTKIKGMPKTTERVGCKEVR